MHLLMQTGIEIGKEHGHNLITPGQQCQSPLQQVQSSPLTSYPGQLVALLLILNSLWALTPAGSSDTKVPPLRLLCDVCTIVKRTRIFINLFRHICYRQHALCVRFAFIFSLILVTRNLLGGGFASLHADVLFIIIFIHVHMICRFADTVSS